MGQSYTLKEIPAGISLFASPIAYSVTDSGEYLITLATSSGPGSAFLLSGIKLKAVTANAGDVFYALNNTDYLIGYGNNGSFLHDSKGKQTLITVPSGDAVFINNLNNKNLLVGQGTPLSGNAYGLLWQNGKVSSYSYPGASGTSINGASDLGDLVGTFTDGQTGASDGFVVKSGKGSVVDVMGLSNISPTMINTSKVIVGYGHPTASQQSQSNVGFVVSAKGVATTVDFSKSAPKAMPGPKGPLLMQPFSASTTLWGMNNHGTVVGQFVSTYADWGVGFGLAMPIVGTH